MPQRLAGFAAPIMGSVVGAAVCLLVSLAMICGCRMDGIDRIGSALAHDGVSPNGATKILVKDKIRVHALAPNPAQSLLVDELVELKTEIESKTGINLSNAPTPIDVYLFKDEMSFREFTAQANAVFADRRAFFIRSKDALNVYGFWGMQVAEDLRHEVTHGYLHGAIPQLDLWIDEGLAEYFEVNPDANGVNATHVRLLADLGRQGNWKPSLERLESITDPTQLTEADYAEAWLWVHFLMSTPIGSEVLTTGLVSSGNVDQIPWSIEVKNMLGDANNQVLNHLAQVTQRTLTPSTVTR